MLPVFRPMFFGVYLAFPNRKEEVLPVFLEKSVGVIFSKFLVRNKGEMLPVLEKLGVDAIRLRQNRGNAAHFAIRLQKNMELPGTIPTPQRQNPES